MPQEVVHMRWLWREEFSKYSLKSVVWKVLRLLLDASCPLTRAKLDERFKWVELYIEYSGFWFRSYIRTTSGCESQIESLNSSAGGILSTRGRHFLSWWPTQDVRRREVSCWKESWPQGKKVKKVQTLILHRVKLMQTQRLTQREGSQSIDAYRELSSQEMELTKMYEELEQNRSVLRLLLQNCPDSIRHLLDR